jgi:hypothetical protein
MKFEIKDSSESRQPYYWREVADNGEVLSHSENYTSKQACENAIAIVKRQAAAAPVYDMTRSAVRR